MEAIKTSFVLHNETIDITDELSNEEAGILFKAILAKVNGREHSIENRILRLIFKPINKQLDRDLKKYENKLQEKSNAGKLGNLKRWNPDLYEQFQKGKININEALKIAEDRKRSQSDKNIAKIADNDNDSVDGNVSVNDNLNDNEDVEEDKIKLNLNDVAKQVFKNPEIENAFIKDHRLKDRNHLIRWGKAFIMHLRKKGVDEKSVEDFRSHFDYWLKGAIERQKKEKQKNNPNSWESGKLDRFDIPNSSNKIPIG